MRNNFLSILAFALVIIGAINWGLVGFFAFDLVAALLGEMSIASRIIYALVGLAGIYLLIDRLTAPRAVDHRTGTATGTTTTATRGTTTGTTTTGTTTGARGTPGTIGVTDTTVTPGTAGTTGTTGTTDNARR